MNYLQKNYDIQIQLRNKRLELKSLEKKLKELFIERNKIYLEGQHDKQRNKREQTLIEYRESIKKIDSEIDNNTKKASVFKEKINRNRSKLVKNLFNKNNKNETNNTDEYFEESVELKESKLVSMLENTKLEEISVNNINNTEINSVNNKETNNTEINSVNNKETNNTNEFIELSNKVNGIIEETNNHYTLINNIHDKIKNIYKTINDTNTDKKINDSITTKELQTIDENIEYTLSMLNTLIDENDRLIEENNKIIKDTTVYINELTIAEKIERDLTPDI